MDTIAKLQKKDKAARVRMLTERETAEERVEYLYNSILRFGAAGAAGYADAKVDDTMAGFTPSELGGLVVGGASLSGMLGRATKPARSMAEGALCGAVYRRAFVAAGGGGGDVEAPAAAVEGGSHVGQLSAVEENDILVALQEEQAAGLAEADELVD